MLVQGREGQQKSSSNLFYENDLMVSDINKENYCLVLNSVHLNIVYFIFF